MAHRVFCHVHLAQAHRLLQGPAGTTVRIRYRRPPNTFDMNCTLLRETGTEHILKEEHGGWKTIDLTDNRLLNDWMISSH
jgi:hypothetical protein